VTLRAARLGISLLALLMSGTARAHATGPGPGRGQATLCVATSAGPANCGPAQADVGRDGSIRLQVDDIVYQLRLHSTQVDIVLMHGAMQIDEFTVPFEWSGRTLRFSDGERDARYEIRFQRSKRVER